MTTSYANQCRICLEYDAVYPIFDRKDDPLSVYSKLKFCITEKIEDLEGFPRQICSICNNTLNIVYDFHKKYAQTYKILKSNLPFIDVAKIEGPDKCFIEIKTEDTENNDDNDHHFDDNHDWHGSPVSHNDGEAWVLKIEEDEKIPKEKPSLDKLLQKLPNITIKKKSSSNESQEEETPVTKKMKKHKEIEKSKPVTNEAKTNLPKKVDRVEKSCLKNIIPEKPHKVRKNIEPAPLKPKTAQKEPSKKPPAKKSTVIDPPPIKRTNIEPAPPKPTTPKTAEPPVKSTPKEPYKYSRLCDQCGESFDCSEKFAHHRRSHFKDPTNKCPICSKEFETNYKLKKHKAMVHTEIYKFSCEHCNMPFYYAKNLASHLLKAHPAVAHKKPLYDCITCGKVYRSSQMLRTHISRHHPEEKTEEEIPMTKW